MKYFLAEDVRNDYVSTQIILLLQRLIAMDFIPMQKIDIGCIHKLRSMIMTRASVLRRLKRQGLQEDVSSYDGDDPLLLLRELVREVKELEALGYLSANLADLRPVLEEKLSKLIEFSNTNAKYSEELLQRKLEEIYMSFRESNSKEFATMSPYDQKRVRMEFDESMAPLTAKIREMRGYIEQRERLIAERNQARD